MLAAFLLTACTSPSDAVSSDPAASDPAASEPIPTTAAGTAGSSDAVTSVPVTATAEVSRVRPEGFETRQARSTLPDGTICEFCVWLADTADLRSRGLMFVTDLGPAQAMAFRYPDPHTGTFWMKDTVLALSIAFYAPDGGFLSSLDMEPCTTDECPSYRTAADFEIAVEVPQGELAELGLVEGSTFELLDLPCDT